LKVLANLIVVIAFCTGTVGAAGMKAPPEAAAPWLLGIGVAGVLLGGMGIRALGRSSRGGADAHDETREEFRRQIEAIRDIVADLDERKTDLSGEELARRIDLLIRNEYFDLTARHEELMKLVGFTEYARIWEGVATAERLLARVWSIATDGYLEEALQDLPAARRNLDLACAAMAKPRIEPG
jgi:hypothetical protein